MKITKLLISLFLGSMVSTQSYATEIEDFMSWAQLGDGTAWIKYTSDYSDDAKFFEA